MPVIIDRENCINKLSTYLNLLKDATSKLDLNLSKIVKTFLT